MVGHRRFGHGVRKMVTSAGTNDLKAYIGEEVVDICVRIFQQELKEAAEDGYASKKPSDVTTNDAEQFDFGQCAQKIQQKVPMFSSMIRSLCCVAGKSWQHNRGELYDVLPEEEQAMRKDELLPRATSQRWRLAVRTWSGRVETVEAKAKAKAETAE
jgi:hypothetical protein